MARMQRKWRSALSTLWVGAKAARREASASSRISFAHSLATLRSTRHSILVAAPSALYLYCAQVLRGTPLEPLPGGDGPRASGRGAHAAALVGLPVLQLRCDRGLALAQTERWCWRQQRRAVQGFRGLGTARGRRRGRGGRGAAIRPRGLRAGRARALQALPAREERLHGVHAGAHHVGLPDAALGQRAGRGEHGNARANAARPQLAATRAARRPVPTLAARLLVTRRGGAGGGPRPETLPAAAQPC